MSLPSARLLLIDDSGAVHTTLTAMVRRAARMRGPGAPSYQIDWVQTVHAGLDAIRGDAYDCYLVDYKVGGESGLDLIRAVRAEGLLVPLIVLTATNVVEQEAAEAGANDYLVKGGFDVPMLERSIRYAIGNADALRRLAAMNGALEQRVADRTQQLVETNKQLVEQIAARKIAETALVRAERMEALGRMTGSVAHDFNNILTALSGSLDLVRIRLGHDANPRLLRPMAIADEATARGRTMVEGLLAFARQQPTAPRLLDVNEVVRGTQDLLRHTVGSGQGLRFDLASGLPHIRADRDQLERALMNLTTNARDALEQASGQNHGHDHKWIAVETGTRQVGPDLSQVRITVRDNGSGMPADIAARAFEPLFTTKADGKGTGLGLAQVYGFARQSGGDAEIASTPGQGTAVSLFLPCAEMALPD